MKKRILGRGLAVALALAFSLAILATAIYVPATADWVMLPLMERYAPPEDTRLPAEEYTPVVSMITAYLQGDDIPFQHVFTAGGTQYAAFNQKEQHQTDPGAPDLPGRTGNVALVGGFFKPVVFVGIFHGISPQTIS